MKTWRMSALTALSGLALTTGALSAQAVASDDQQDAARAAALEQEARTVLDEKADWGKASTLFREAADLQADDPAAASNYRQAGLLAFYAGREGSAIDHLTRAAETALAWGDVLTAAQSYLDAAWVAHEEGDGARTLEFARRAERLAASPLLARAERARLMNRIAEEPQPLPHPGS